MGEGGGEEKQRRLFFSPSEPAKGPIGENHEGRLGLWDWGRDWDKNEEDSRKGRDPTEKNRRYVQEPKTGGEESPEPKMLERALRRSLQEHGR